MVIGSLEFKERADAPVAPGPGKNKVFFNQSGQLVSIGASGGPDPFLRESDITTVLPHNHDDLYYRKSTAVALSLALA